jgi:NAD(P)-dependent dehydrogenase (short-subunit alcohol dehydrogenase family)
MPVYVLTGANRGLGLEFVRQLSADSSNTVIGAVRSLSNDLTDLKALNKNNNIHILECVPEQSSLSITESDMNEHINVNVIGPAKTTEGFYKADLLSSDVRILNMTSGLGSMKASIGIKPRKCTTYSISKAALNMLTVHQGEELREKLPDVVVISMDPGWVKTRMGGEGAMIEAHESINGMLKVLHGLKKDDTASFWTYSGEQVPW